MASLKLSGTFPSSIDLLMMLVMRGTSWSLQCLISHVGAGSSSQDAVAAFLMIRSTSPSVDADNSVKGLAWNGLSFNIVSWVMWLELLLSFILSRIVLILLAKNLLKFSARSALFVCDGRLSEPLSPVSALVSLNKRFWSRYLDIYPE